jgi:hypothetical protein
MTAIASGSCAGGGRAFEALIASENIKVIRTPVQAPNANAHIERWVGTIRRECLDRLLIVGRRQLQHVLCVYVDPTTAEDLIAHFTNTNSPQHDDGVLAPHGPRHARSRRHSPARHDECGVPSAHADSTTSDPRCAPGWAGSVAKLDRLSRS